MNKINVSNWKTVMCASGSILLGGVAIKLLKIGNVFTRQNDIPINEVLLYGANDEVHTKQIGLNNLFCIYYVIVHANCSIDVCVPDLESETIAKCLIGAQLKNKVKVRLIVHSNNDFDMTRLAKHGIDVKIVKSRQPLEHEFILVDAEETGEAVAVMGSLDYDYETARVNCNRDATMLTSEQSVVKALRREFDRVWDSADNRGKGEHS